MHQYRSTRPSGSGLIEVVVAIGLAALLLAAVAPVTARTVQIAEQSRLTTLAQTAAASQLDRLRALPWYELADGTNAVDAWSLLDADGFAQGGPGLAHSVGNPLETATASYGDLLPSVGNVPAGVALARRWRVTGVPAQLSCLLLVVEVAPVSALNGGLLMEQAALGRAQAIRCADGVRP